MAKDKLITIRIEESKRIAFQEWSEKNKINGATFLYKVIDKCIANELSVALIDSKSSLESSSLTNIQKSIQQLSEKLERRIIEQDNRLASLESEIENLKAILNSQKTQKHISEPTESKLASTRRIAKRVDEPSKSTQKLSKRVYKSDKEDDLLTDTQLAEILGVSRTAVSRWRIGQRKPSGKHSNLFNLYEVVDKKWRKI